MKLFLLSIISIVLSTISYGQKDKSEKGLTFLKLSLNSANIRSRLTSENDYSSAKSRVGYGIGLDRLTELKTDRIYLSTQIAFNSIGYKDVRTNYIHVPVTVNFFVGKSKLFYLGVGVYGGVMINGKYKNISDDWVKMKIGDNATDNRTRTDYGIAYNIAYTFAEGYPFIQLNMMSGIKNLIPSDRIVNGAKNKIGVAELSFRLPLNVMKKLTKKLG